MNDYISNPILIDSPMTESWKMEVANSLGSPLTLQIVKVEYYKPVTIGDTVTIVNASNGQNLLDFTCEVALQSQIVDFTAKPLLWSDFSVTRIDSGILKIWYA